MNLITIGSDYVWVRCKYRYVGWIGIRLDHRFGNCYNYLIVFDKNGNPARRRMIKQYNDDWMDKIPSRIHQINKDWLCIKE